MISFTFTNPSFLLGSEVNILTNSLNLYNIKNSYDSVSITVEIDCGIDFLHNFSNLRVPKILANYDVENFSLWSSVKIKVDMIQRSTLSMKQYTVNINIFY